MSENSNNNNNETDINTNALISFQTQDIDTNTEDNIELSSDRTASPLLPQLCSYPTELFETLLPISLLEISFESSQVVADRREPIGGEDSNPDNNLNAFVNQSIDENVGQMLEPIETSEVVDRPPLIGQNSGSSRSTIFTLSHKSDESVGIVSVRDTDRDALAAKVRQLLGRTKREANDEELDSLGLIQVINETLDPNLSYATVGSERSEPDGKGKPFLMTLTTQKLVHYSSSESEDDEEVEEVSDSSENISEKSFSKMDRFIDKQSIRNRSYSANSRTGLKKSVGTGFDISFILRQRMQTKDNLMKESSETQTNRSFLAELAINTENETRVKRPNPQSKGIQTTDSLLNIELSAEKRKQLKDFGSQTNTSFGISSFLKEMLRNSEKVKKVSAGTQTIRSYLTEQSLKQKNKENRVPNKELIPNTLITKAIQTSLTSSRNSESDSPIIERISEKFGIWKNENKEPISWFIPYDQNPKNKNISRISKPYSRSSVLKSREKQNIISSSSPVPLQEAFDRHCVDMRINSQIRINRIHTIADIRKRTADQRLIEMAKQFVRQQEKAKVIKANVIQPVFQSSIKRLFTHEEMRAQTEKIYNNLPEVKAKRDRKKQKEREQNQRLLAQIYKYRLKDNALKGRLTWKITQSCL